MSPTVIVDFAVHSPIEPATPEVRHMNTSNTPIQAERRQNPGLRALFEEAYALVEPCLDPKQTWGGVPLEHLAFPG
jgi:hypothetical protein